MADGFASPGEARVGEFDGRGGARIAFRASTVSSPRATLLFVHGLGDHSGWFGPLSSVANASGLDWYGIDLRGHGLSSGKRGHVDSLGDVLQDVDALRRIIAASGDAGTHRPLLIGGHSLGGLVALRYVQESPGGVAGLLLVAPFLAVAARVPAWKRITGRLANRLLPRMTLGNGLVYADLISDPEALEARDADPLAHDRISARLWAEVLAAQARAHIPAPLPAMFQLAADDRAVQTPAAETLCAAWEYPSRCVVYPGTLHDLYHDRVAGRVLADAMDWISETI